MKPRLLFVTDPMCSWCWGTLPEVSGVRRSLSGQVDFDLAMARLTVGGERELSDYHKGRLVKLWREVRQVTGQVFSERFPDGIVFDSRNACCAVEMARLQTGEPPWEFFATLQAAFFVDGRDITRSTVIAELLGQSVEDVESALVASDSATAMDAGFAMLRRLSAHALPSIYLDTGEGLKLVSGGFISAEFLAEEILCRLRQAELGEGTASGD